MNLPSIDLWIIHDNLCFPPEERNEIVMKKVLNDRNGAVDWEGRLVKDSLFEKKVVYLQRQNDKKEHPYNQYEQLCSIQKKLKT